MAEILYRIDVKGAVLELCQYSDSWYPNLCGQTPEEEELPGMSGQDQPTDWQRIDYQIAVSDIRWAKEQGWRVLQWTILLLAAITGLDTFRRLSPILAPVLAILLACAAMYFLWDLHRFGANSRATAARVRGRRQPRDGFDTDHVRYLSLQILIVLTALFLTLLTVFSGETAIEARPSLRSHSMELILVAGTAVMAAATAVIAWSTVRSFALHRRQADLAQAVVIAGVVSAAGQADQAVPRFIERFKTYYTGETSIFPDNNEDAQGKPDNA